MGFQVYLSSFSFNVKPEHYLIFGECFFTAIKDVLGEAANNDVMNGWMEGYLHLAEILIKLEMDLKKENEKKTGKVQQFLYFCS